MLKRRKKALFLCVVAAATLFLLYALLPTLAWIGGSRVTLNIRVTDQGRGPLADAKVRVSDARHLEYQAGADWPWESTDTNGSASVTIRVGAGGGTKLFSKKGRIVINHELQVEKAGYRPIAVPVQDIVGGRYWDLSKESFDLSMEMIRKLQTEN
jgi:hypothetical protein